MELFKEMNNKKIRTGGFTLVEIMIVVAIIGLLIGVAVPKFSKMRSDAQETSCFVQLKQIDNAKEIWATREKRANGQIPTAEQLAESGFTNINYVSNLKLADMVMEVMEQKIVEEL